MMKVFFRALENAIVKKKQQFWSCKFTKGSLRFTLRPNNFVDELNFAVNSTPGKGHRFVDIK